MIKLALTGPQLAELYLMNAMGVPNNKLLEESQGVPYSQRIYSVDTEYGRSKLVRYAIDLLNNIRETNNAVIGFFLSSNEFIQMVHSYVLNNDKEYYNAVIKPSIIDEQGATSVNDQMIKEIKNVLSYYGSEKLNSLLKNFDSPDDIVITNVKNINLHSINSLMMGFIDELEEATSYDTVGDPDDSLWINQLRKDVDYVFSTESDAARVIIKLNDLLRLLLNNYSFIRSCVDYNVIFSRYTFIEEEKLINNYIERWWDRITEDIIEDVLKNVENVDDTHFFHFKIDNFLNDVEKVVDKVKKQDATRDDFLKVMEMVDKISSMSHHGGPLFEYGDTTFQHDDGWSDEWGNDGRNVIRSPSLIEIMHRKFGDYFITWALLNNIIEDESLKKDLEQWYEEAKSKEVLDVYHQDLMFKDDDDPGINLDVNLSRDDYYKHFRFQKPKDFDQYVVYNSPLLLDFTPQQWSEEYEGNYPHLAQYIKKRRGFMNVEDILNIASIRDAVNERLKYIQKQDGLSNDQTMKRITEIQSFLSNYNDVTDDVIDDARKFSNDIKQKKLNLWKKEAQGLDANGFHVQADILEKNMYKMIGN